MFMISTLASIGLPGLNGFVGEFMILLGSFKSNYVANGIVIISTTGVIVAAVYMLWMFRRVMFGEIRLPENHQIPDLTKSEIGVLLPLVLLMFVIGLHATPFLSEIGKSSDIIVQSVFQSKVSVPGLGWN
jgi:NADH-quinone oxidoreductase subunit M